MNDDRVITVMFQWNHSSLVLNKAWLKLKKVKIFKNPKTSKGWEKEKKKQKGHNDQQETSACEFNRLVNIWPIILENRPSASELGSLWIIHCSWKLANNHNFWEDVKYFFAYFVRVCGNYFTRKKSVVFLKIKKHNPFLGILGVGLKDSKRIFDLNMF